MLNVIENNMQLTSWCKQGTKSREHEFYLTGTVDKVFTLNGAAISLHSHNVAFLHHHLLNSGPVQNLDPWKPTEMKHEEEDRERDKNGAKSGFPLKLPCRAAATASAWLTSGEDTTASSGRCSAPTRSWMLTRGWSLAISLGLIMLQLIPNTLWIN